MTSTKEFIAKLLEEHKASDIAMVEFENCKDSRIEGLTPEFIAIEDICAKNLGLTTLEGFPKLDSLLRVELSDNQLEDISPLKDCICIREINLANNKISSLESLMPLSHLPMLDDLILDGNPVTDEDNFEEDIFKVLPDLKCLNSELKNPNYSDESDSEYDEEDDDEEEELDEEVGCEALVAVDDIADDEDDYNPGEEEESEEESFNESEEEEDCNVTEVSVDSEGRKRKNDSSNETNGKNGFHEEETAAKLKKVNDEEVPVETDGVN